MAAPVAIEVRQARIFELIGQGYTHTRICKQLDISPDTLSRDLEAISDQVQETLGKRREALVTEALANYRAVVQMAWTEYRADLKRETDVQKGKLDYTHENLSTKTLATEGDEAAGQPAIMDESGAIEVKRERRIYRPTYTNTRAQWLKLVIEATREITELFAVKKLVIEHQGHVTIQQLNDAQRAERVNQLLDSARARRAGSAADGAQPEGSGA